MQNTYPDAPAALDGLLFDGITALMTGKLKIEGDMSNAMQLQSVVAKLGG